MKAIIEGVEKIVVNWNSIFGMAIKLYYLQNRETLIKKIAEKIIMVANEEEHVANLLLDLVEGNYRDLDSAGSNTGMMKPLELVKDYEFIDLSNHFNNQGFDSPDTVGGKAEFSNKDKFFITDGLPREQLWTIDNLKSMFPEIKEGEYDNISCDGQVISLKKGVYSSIALLGCAEYGSHRDALEIYFEDGTIEKVMIEASNWALEKPKFNEKIAWTGYSAVRKTNGVQVYPFEVYINAKRYKIKHNGVVSKIKLPQCLNMHYFSITLEK